MKLTPAQIEIERKKFEDITSCLNYFYWDSAQKRYRQKVRGFPSAEEVAELEGKWIGWIACRESSNEIEFPYPFAIYGEAHLGNKYYLESAVVVMLNIQGFTVKSQGE